MGLSNSRCLSVGYSSGSLGSSYAVYADENMGYLDSPLTFTTGSGDRLFNLTAHFTSNYQVDPLSVIWASFCDINAKCASFATNKQALTTGVFVNTTGFGEISSGITLNITTSDYVEPNDKFTVYFSQFEMCNFGTCFGRMACNPSVSSNMTGVMNTCGYTAPGKICTKGAAKVTRDLNFADYGIDTIVDTSVIVSPPATSNAVASSIGTYWVFIAYSNNVPFSYPSFTNLTNDLVTLKYSTNEVIITETILRSELDQFGFMLHGKNISDIVVSWGVANGTDSFSITKFIVCNNYYCQGVQNCYVPEQSSLYIKSCGAGNGGFGYETSSSLSVFNTHLGKCN